MNKSERLDLGKVGVTRAEADAKAVAKAERQLQSQLAQYLGLRNIYYTWHRTDKRSTAAPGTPDFIICYHGHYVALEVKVGGGKLTPEQEEALSKIRKCGGVAHVVRSLHDVRVILCALDHGITATKL